MDQVSENSLLITLIYPIVTGVIAGLVTNLISKYFSFFRIEENCVEFISKKEIIVQEKIKASGTMLEYVSDKIRNSRLFFFIFSFYILYVFIALPLFWKVQPFFMDKNIIYLSQARIIGRFLPEILIDNKLFQWPIILTTLVLYYPLLSFTKSITNFVIIFFLTKTNAPVTKDFIRLFEICLFFLLSAIVCSFVIYLYYDVTLKESTIRVFVLISLFLCLFLQKNKN
ncbi:MAG: hypothetical protein EPO11_10495 [Gammaproteobacteria bacterium]|nr:MAG: hypothetical protein EPO11_10495 [Gammaproteobacteria bacterium]